MNALIIFATLMTMSFSLVFAIKGMPEYGVLVCFFMSLAFNALDALKKD